MQTYKDLEVYKIAHGVAVEIHKMTLEQLPKFEMYEVGSQIRRSSKSIAVTIVEGFGRKQYQQEYIKYLTYALSSVDETKEHLQMLFDTKSLAEEKVFKHFLEQYGGLGKKLYKLRERIQKDLKQA